MNKMPDRPSDILSECSYRHPTFKFHNKLAHAKNAIALKGWGRIWVWDWQEDKWVVLYDIPKPSPEDYRSGRYGLLPWQKD